MIVVFLTTDNITTTFHLYDASATTLSSAQLGLATRRPLNFPTAAVVRHHLRNSSGHEDCR